MTEVSAGAQPRNLAQGAHAGIVDTRSPTGEVDVATLDRPVCCFFLRTGTCAYGDRCKFLHPRDRPPPVLNSRGYPLRTDEVDCAHYLKKGWCAFNLTCKYNHPELPPPVLPASPFGAGLGYISIAATAGGFPPPSAMYSLAPPAALPLMYYVPSPIGPQPLGANGFQASSHPAPAPYVPSSGVGVASIAGSAMYHQQQQQQHMLLANAAIARQQQPLQHAMYGMPDQLLQPAARMDHISNAMQRLQVGRGDAAPRPPNQRHPQQQQQQR